MPRNPPLDPPALDRRVPIVPTTSGDDGTLAQAALSTDPHGVVVGTLGAGHLPPDLLELWSQEAQRILPGSTVVAAFHHVSAVLLDDPEVTDIPGDVLVLGEDRDVVGQVVELAAAIPGARGVYAGRLRLARTVESFTANLIAVNRRYKAHAGIAVTGLPEPSDTSGGNAS